MKPFQVSVLIPVCNAAAHVQSAVESALSQPETAEVILAEDGSSDNSLQVCQELAAKFPKVFLYRHSDGGNHGAGATRNLAIQKSSFEYIAFLDADDYFLPNRFAIARQLFATNADIDGVYDAIAMHIEDEAGEQRWLAAGRSQERLNTMTKRFLPEDLFEALVVGGSGSFHIDGLVLKRTVIERTGYMDEDLPLHQDTAIMVKAAGVAKLIPGNLEEPIARWRVHAHNRISTPRPKSAIYQLKLKFWFSLWKWSRVHLNQEQQQLLLYALIREAKFRTRFHHSFPTGLSALQQRLQLFLLVFQYPFVIKESVFWKSFFPDLGLWLRYRKAR
jgi:glycosyltransferase involved in cell wall biosynthesis